MGRTPHIASDVTKSDLNKLGEIMDAPTETFAPPRLTVGILEAGPNAPHLVPDHGTYGDWFITYLAATDPHLEFRAYRAYDDHFPDDPEDCHAYVVTGSKFSVLDGEDWMHKLADLTHRAAKTRPVIGICFGHQLLHHSLGGRVANSDKGWGIGVHEYDMVEHAPWMEETDASFAILASHQDQVVEAAPNSRLLAASAFCPVAMSTIGDNILTMQGHPEATKDCFKKIYDSRRHVIQHHVVEEAMESLAQETTEALVARWMVRFMRARAAF